MAYLESSWTFTITIFLTIFAEKLHRRCLAGFWILLCKRFFKVSKNGYKKESSSLTHYFVTGDSRKLKYSISLRIFDSSNKFFSPLIITHYIRQKISINQISISPISQYKSNKIFGPFDDSLSLPRTFIITFRPQLEGLKIRTFYLTYCKQNKTKYY